MICAEGHSHDRFATTRWRVVMQPASTESRDTGHALTGLPQPLTLAVSPQRLRQRSRERVSEELADTVASAKDLAVERPALHAVLRARQRST